MKGTTINLESAAQNKLLRCVNNVLRIVEIHEFFQKALHQLEPKSQTVPKCPSWDEPLVMAQGEAKVSWKSICKPKEYGGLGIKRLLEWNEVLLTRQLWKVVLKEKTLWVKWINTERLKGKSIWMANVGSSSSAGWKDLWDSLGHLSDTISSRDIHEAGLTMESTLAELVNINNGNWPEGWEDEYPILSNIAQLSNGIEDKIVWVDNTGAERVFGTRIVWKDWSYYGAKMEWYPVIWYNMSIPKHTFVVWMALQNKLMTQENIAKWKDDDGMKCSLCQCCMDSIEHLFFMCPYTNAVWGEIQKMLNVQLSYVWHIIVDELIGNRRMFQNEKREVKNVVEIIKETVRLKLASFVVKNGRTVRNVEAVWGIKFYRKV
ncbi:RNA-directed DNA polymerase, eukaryota, reverse transcriptase zinc-binding domain protein [Tanacetum coccineum]